MSNDKKTDSLPDIPARDLVSEAYTHLVAAIVQSLPDVDDQIIMGHVRAAHELLGIVLKRTP